MNRELAHLAELDLHAFMAAVLTARLVGGGELVNAAAVTCNALDALEIRVGRFEVDTVADGVRDLLPLFRVALDVAFRADFARHFRVVRDRIRLLENLPERHLAALHHAWTVACLAAEPAVRALLEAHERPGHQMAGSAEIVVVLDVIVRPIHPNRSDNYDKSERASARYQPTLREVANPLAHTASNAFNHARKHAQPEYHARASEKALCGADNPILLSSVYRRNCR